MNSRRKQIKRTVFNCKRGAFTVSGTEYRNNADNGIPVIISHGFLSNQRRLKMYAEHLAEQGFAVFAYDFCGGGLMSKSDGKFKDMSLDTEKQDLSCVIDYVSALDYVDISKLILMGQSQGGLVSCLIAAERQVDKLILLYPALCIPDDARRGKMLFIRFDPENIEDTLKCKLFGFSPEYPKSAVNINVYEIMEKIEASVLIIHGNKDKIVDIGYAEKAVRHTKNGRLSVIDGAGHGFKKRNVIIANKIIEDFL